MEGVSGYFQNKNKKEKIISQLDLPAASHLWCRRHDSGQCRASLQSLRPLPVDPKEEEKQLLLFFFRNKTKINRLTFLPPALGSTPSFWLWARTASRCSRRRSPEESPGGRAGGGRRGTGQARRRGGRATADPAATAEEPAASAVAEGDDRACGSRGRAGQAHRRGGRRSSWRLPRKSWPSSPPRRSWPKFISPPRRRADGAVTKNDVGVVVGRMRRRARACVMMCCCDREGGGVRVRDGEVA